jgi:hypothetical protein
MVTDVSLVPVACDAAARGSSGDHMERRDAGRLAVVDWVALDHAYGPADDLPQVIRAAASTDKEQAEAAVDELFSCVFHQGTVYSASVAVVPC